jgi:uncharacterized membrane protein (UPF0127 family)
MLQNLTRKTLLAKHPAEAAGFWGRFLGLMGRKSFPREYDALVFENCTSIHCFFMFMVIDAVFIDKEGRAVRCFHGLRPWHLAFGGRKSRSVIELPAGTLKQSGTEPGDQLSFE